MLLDNSTSLPAIAALPNAQRARVGRVNTPRPWVGLVGWEGSGPPCGRLLPVLLNAGGAQAGETVLIDGILPGQEFLDRERIATASLLQRQETAAHGGYNLRLAPDHPALGARRRQIGDGQRAAVGPDDVFDPRAMGLGHWKALTQDDELDQRTLWFAA